MARKKNRSDETIANVAADGIDEDAINLQLKKLHPLDRYLDELFHKREPKRNKALMSIIEWLYNKVEHNFVEEKFATLLYRFMFCIKKGSYEGIHLASHAIGLLPLMTACEDKTHEIYEEAIPLLVEVLKSKSKNPMTFHCLAIVTLFGATNVGETESSMLILWEFIDSESGSDSFLGKYSSDIVAAAISSWSLLLSSMDSWKFSYRYWQGAISCLLNLLETNDEKVCIAAGEALALIFETGSIEKFSKKCDADGNSSEHRPSNYGIHEKLVKEKVLKKLMQLSVMNDEKSAKPDSVQRCNGNWDVIHFFKDGKYPENSLSNRKHVSSISSTWARKVQIKCFMRYLGEHGFDVHMRGNRILQDFFDYKPIQRSVSGVELYEPAIDEVCVRVYYPREKANLGNLTSEQIKSLRNMRLSITKKAQTILLKKHRLQAEIRGSDDF